MSLEPLKPLSDQVVVVVGASSGIGRETARRAAAEGARVVAAARDVGALQSLVDEIRASGGEGISVPTDVSDFAQVKRLADRAAAEYGRIDTWVHLAAVGGWGRLEETPPEDFARVIEVNLTGQAYGAIAALPHLRRAGGGAFISVSSGEGKIPVPLQSAYVASKHGLIGMLDVLRMELAHERSPITVTNVMPSGINTPFFEKSPTRLGVLPRPLPPVYDPRLVADAILFAAVHRTDEIVVGGAAQGGILGRRVAPRLVDAVMSRVAFPIQRTRQPKGADAPHALFAPLAGYGRVDGPFPNETRSTSLSTWAATHPRARRALGALALVVATVVLSRGTREG